MADATSIVERDLEDREQKELLAALKRATIGEYDVYSAIGHGGMATVFLALELSLNRPVAIKVISPSALSSTTIIERFWLEARTAASLSHPNVIPIYAVRCVNGLHFFVMKHIQGGSLDAILRTEGRFSFALTRVVLIHVTSALAYAHRRGVVHRDIKPANIMLDDEGYAVVTDFGIAKVRDVAALTASGAMVGTPSYMSPEQFNGGQIDGRSDQYSLGVVAFELLTGERPFKGKSIAEIMRGHLLDKVPDVRDFRRDCPTALATLVNRMLRKPAADRFPTMDAVCDQLEAMPRTDHDRIKRQIIALARTASQSTPQISVPQSPIPLSRTSAGSSPAPGRVSSLPAARRSRRLIPMFAGGMVFVALAALAGSQIIDNWDKIVATSMVSSRTPAVPKVDSSAMTKAQTSALAPTVSTDSSQDKPILQKGDSIAKPVDQPVDQPAAKPVEQDRKRTERQPRRSNPPPVTLLPIEPGPGDALADTVAAKKPAVIPAPAPPPSPHFRIGSRLPGAGLYLNGRFVELLGRTMKTYPHPAGRVHIQIRAEDCVSFDTLLYLKDGDSATIGWRQPRCTR